MLDFELVFFVSAVHTTFQKRNPSVDLGRFCCRGEQPASPPPFVKLCECGDGELWWRGPCPSLVPFLHGNAQHHAGLLGTSTPSW